LATYGREGDVIRFYEIDPAVLRFAESHFTYLKECAGEIQQVLGDARLSLESEEPQEFDILVLDAFTGDSIPVHLLTAEAMQLYLDHLRPDGVMCFNISNWRLDLKPVLKGLADHLGLHAALVPAPADPKKGISPCEWVLLAPNPKILELAEIRKVSRPLKSTKKVRMWTDDFSNLFQIMNFRQIESQ
jgi:hypothetical protein